MEKKESKLIRISKASSSESRLILPDTFCASEDIRCANTTSKAVHLSDDFIHNFKNPTNPLENDSTKGSLANYLTLPNPHKSLRPAAAKRDAPACKGQGDDPENSVLSSSYSLSFKDSDFSPEDLSLPAVQLTCPDDSEQLTYTTLLPKHDYPKQEIYLESPSSGEFITSSPVFHPPTRPTSYAQKRKVSLLPEAETFSPIPKIYMQEPKPRRKRGRPPKYHYYSQLYRSSRSSSLESSSASLTPSSSTSTSGSSILVSGCLAPGASQSLSRSTSGSHPSQWSIEYPRAPNNTPTSAAGSRLLQEVDVDWMEELQNQMTDFSHLYPKEVHNEKERQRRLRIKMACNEMRRLLPFVSEKTDNATVFEHAAAFISFMKDTAGTNNLGDDLEFISENLLNCETD